MWRPGHFTDEVSALEPVSSQLHDQVHKAQWPAAARQVLLRAGDGSDSISGAAGECSGAQGWLCTPPRLQAFP